MDITHPPVVTSFRIVLPVVYYACPHCGAARETSIGRWERGDALQCLRCREIYHLPPTTRETTP